VAGLNLTYIIMSLSAFWQLN